MPANEEKWSVQVRSLLLYNVPRFIDNIKARGLSKEEWDWVSCEEVSVDYPMHLFDQADIYLLYPKDEETFNHGLFVLVKALAIMSFIPGGVRIFDLRFGSEIDNFVVVEDDQA